MDGAVSIHDIEGDGPLLPLLDGPGEVRAVIWPGMGAAHRSIHRYRIEPGTATVPLSHPGEAVFFVHAGLGVVEDAGSGETQAIRPSEIVHVDGGTAYRFRCPGPEPLVLLGGPAPPDPALYEHLDVEGA
jgi:mannose-6-phosphate isomerase-like protein (cupin superfamily)